MSHTFLVIERQTITDPNPQVICTFTDADVAFEHAQTLNSERERFEDVGFTCEYVVDRKPTYSNPVPRHDVIEFYDLINWGERIPATVTEPELRHLRIWEYETARLAEEMTVELTYSYIRVVVRTREGRERFEELLEQARSRVHQAQVDAGR